MKAEASTPLRSVENTASSKSITKLSTPKATTATTSVKHVTGGDSSTRKENVATATKTMMSRAELDAIANSVFTSVAKTASATKLQMPSKALLSTPSRPSSSTSFSSSLTTPTAATTKAIVAKTPGSANAREAAKIAKINMTADKILKTKELKDKWAKDKEENVRKNQEKKSEEMKKLQESTEAAAILRKKQLEIQRTLEDKKKEEEKELLLSSLNERKYVSDELKRIEKEKRRESIMLNNEIHRKVIMKTEEEISKKKEVEEEAFSLKRHNHLQLRQNKKVDEMKKRQSIISRGVQHKKEKAVMMKINQQKDDEEKEILSIRRDNSIKKNEYNQEQIKRDRQSISNRIDVWRQQKNKENMKKQEVEQYNHYILETRRLDWQDMDDYKAVQQKRSRESVAWRLDKWRDEKKLDEKQKLEQQEADEYEYILKQQEADDIKAYKLQLDNQRKQSLLHRLDKAKIDKQHDEKSASLQQKEEESDRRIAADDRADVAEYMDRILQSRRQSLEYRSQQALQDRIRTEAERSALKEQERKDKELYLQSLEDVKKYQETEKENKRRSLAFRLVEDRKHHELMLAQRQSKLNEMHTELQLKRLETIEVKQETEEMNAERRRKSIAFNMDSWRQQRLAEEMLEAKKAMIEEEEFKYRQYDREDIQLAKARQQQELR